MIPPMLALIALCEERGISLHVSFDPDPGPFPRWLIDLGVIGDIGDRVGEGATAEDAATAALAAADQEDTDG